MIDEYAGCNSAYTQSLHCTRVASAICQFELISILKLSRGLPLMHPGRQSDAVADKTGSRTWHSFTDSGGPASILLDAISVMIDKRDKREN